MSKLGTIVVEDGQLLILDADGKAGASFAAECCLVVEAGTHGRSKLVRYDHQNPAHALAVAKTAFPDKPKDGEEPKAGEPTPSKAARVEAIAAELPPAAPLKEGEEPAPAKAAPVASWDVHDDS